MMKQLLEKINEAMAQEKALADKDHGPIKSRHEGYGVLAEEIRELGLEFKDVSWWYDTLLEHIDDEIWVRRVESLRAAAKLCAAEAVQVASVCDRILDAEETVCDTCKIDLSEGGEN